MSFKKILTAGKLLVLSLTVVAAGALISEVRAVSDADTANTLRISPVRTDVTADPGETSTVKITVTNPTDIRVAVQPIQNDFVAGDEAGSPALILDEDEYAPKHSLKRFLQPLEAFELDGGESRTIDAVIEVPEDAEAGGYFGAIRFAPTDPDTGGQVNMSVSVASIVLLRVNGEAPEQLDLTDFAIKQDNKLGSFFMSTNDMVVTARFTNGGEVQLSPFGKISVTRGNQVVYEVDFNDNDQRDMVLPDSARRWDIPLQDIEGFGKYTVSATFTYGSDNKTIEVSTDFWVVPWTMIIGAGVGLLLIAGVIIALVVRRRRSRRGMSMGRTRR